jgi:hypothetical protein
LWIQASSLKQLLRIWSSSSAIWPPTPPTNGEAANNINKASENPIKADRKPDIWRQSRVDAAKKKKKTKPGLSHIYLRGRSQSLCA